MERLVIETPEEGQQVLEQIGRRFKKRISASPLGLCPVDMLLNYLRICHAQSCGKCSPCRIGLWHLTEMLETIRNGTGDMETIDLIEKTADIIRVSADCAIGYEAANMVLEGMQGFRKDMEEHIKRGRCLYGIEQAIPCTAVCPAHVDVPGYISLVKAGRYKDAVRLIRKDNPFPAVCGYVCEHPCEKRCRRQMVDDSVNICGIKRYAVDHAGDIPVPQCAPATGKTVAVIGGGPGGLTAAYFLTVMGHEVTVYEQRHHLGGMLRYGIPDYRLPNDILDRDIQYLLDTGVNVILNTNIGEDMSIDELKAKYDAVYMSIGAHDDKKLKLAGEDAPNVYSAVELLRAIGEDEAPNLKGKKVVVVGGGNVAMDATRSTLRLGASSVTCVYRRRIADMTALPEEIAEAQAEGVKIRTLLAPDHIELDKKTKRAKALWVQPQLISLIGQDGRTSVRKAEEKAFPIECDYIIVAIGQSIHSQPFEGSGLKLKHGVIAAESSSFVPGSGNVFAGGDAVSGPATVIRAVAAGKVAANNIDYFLGYNHVIKSGVEVPDPQMTNNPPCGRVNLTSHMIDNIEGNFDLVSIGMTPQGVKQECGRCLRCDHFGFGSFRGGRKIQW